MRFDAYTASRAKGPIVHPEEAGGQRGAQRRHAAAEGSAQVQRLQARPPRRSERCSARRRWCRIGGVDHRQAAQRRQVGALQQMAAPLPAL